MQSSPAYSWLGGSQGSSSGLIVKKTMKVDIPVDKYPTVSVLFHKLVYSLIAASSSSVYVYSPSTILLAASLVQEEIP
jgi:hypothetical protein